MDWFYPRLFVSYGQQTATQRTVELGIDADAAQVSQVGRQGCSNDGLAFNINKGPPCAAYQRAALQIALDQFVAVGVERQTLQ